MKGKAKSKRDNRAERRQAKRRSVCAEKNAAPPASTEDVEDEDVVKAPILPPMHLPEAVNAADDKNDAPNEEEETCAEKKLAPPAGTEEDVVESPILPTTHLPEAVNADDKNDAPNENEETHDDASVPVQDFAEPNDASKEDKANADDEEVNELDANDGNGQDVEETKDDLDANDGNEDDEQYADANEEDSGLADVLTFHGASTEYCSE